MAQIDTYLVEKLREILQRLYVNGRNGFVEKKLGTEEEQNPHKRSSPLFPFAPTGYRPSKTELISDTLPFDNDKVDNISTSSYSAPVSDFTEPVNSSTVYGVEVVNCTTIEAANNSLSDLDEQDESAALTQSLHEFIHILKTYLKSGTTLFYSSEGRQPESYGVSHDTLDKSVPSTNPFSGIEAASNTKMEFNLTLDDIIDLNSLLEEPPTSLPLKHVLIIFMYTLIACISIVGNLLIIQLVIRSRRFHTLTHALLANLAAADLVLATFNIPFSAARVIMTEWPFGSFLCRAIPFLQVMSVYSTSFTMATIENNETKSVPIAVDRYQVIMNPLGKRLKCSQGVLLVIAIWFFSAILSLPYALTHQVVTVLTVRVVKRCQAEFGFPHARQLLTVLTFLAQYLLPLGFTTASYISIMKRLWHRSSGLGSTTPRQNALQSRAKLKTIKMLILTLIFFAVTWLPINLYHLFTQFSHVRHNSTVLLVCHIIAMSSSMYNPFIFCGLNEHFRREAVKWLRCFRTRRSPVVHPGMEVNGILARADQGPRRNLSTTMIHTAISSGRSTHQQLSLSPRLHARLGTSSSTAAIYMTPHHSGIHGGSPTVTRLIGNVESTINASTSSAGYQPELLFLVRDSVLSRNDNGDIEALESLDQPNADDFLDSLEDKLYQSKKKVGKFAKDNEILTDDESHQGTDSNHEERNSDGEIRESMM